MAELELYLAILSGVATLGAFIACVVMLLAAYAAPPLCDCQNCYGADLRELIDTIDEDLSDVRTYNDATYRASLKYYRDSVSRLLSEPDDESEVG